jgi:putative transposase
MSIKDLAQMRVSYGYRRIHVLLLREGWKVNHKWVYRLYKLEGLMMRPKRPRRHVSSCRRVKVIASYPNESWPVDFMSDALYDGQKIKLLTLVDNFTRESLAIEVAYRLGGHGMVATLMQVAKARGLPKSISIDNGPEFTTSKVLDQWAYLSGAELDFIRPGKPTDNALIGAFNGRFREECLNESWFLSIEDAQEKVEEWRQHYDRERPHGSLGSVPPLEFAGISAAK